MKRNMLFNSYDFIFLFFPIVVIGFFLIGKKRPLAAAGWLAMVSVFFYAWWNWRFTFILAASVICNYAVGIVLAKWRGAGQTRGVSWLLFAAVAANIAALSYYKYAVFFISSANQTFHLNIDWPAIILPIGISFFTFTQIAFLVDTARGKASEVNFIHYLLFVTYFPHLIAGPILHHTEMMPQFRRSETYRPRANAIAVGMTVFVFGLFKKVVLADQVGTYADLAFSPAHSHNLTFIEAWAGTLAYTLQIYFDFSAYSDMAIGLSRILNVKLPANFESPYKARSIIDFWRRWHMTLSRFLRDYLYIPLGGNRRGAVRRHANLLITMGLGGLWHGAGWTFIIWGLLHGFYLVLNHAWHVAIRLLNLEGMRGGAIGRAAAWALTFLSVVVAWVFFRAPDLDTAIAILNGMAGHHGVVLPLQWENALAPVTPFLLQHGVAFAALPTIHKMIEFRWLAALLAVSVFAPNVRQMMAKEETVLATDERAPSQAAPIVPSWMRWQPKTSWALLSFAILTISLARMTRISEFLYFQF